jgi:hypothetical protein
LTTAHLLEEKAPKLRPLTQGYRLRVDSVADGRHVWRVPPAAL